MHRIFFGSRKRRYTQIETNDESLSPPRKRQRPGEVQNNNRNRSMVTVEHGRKSRRTIRLKRGTKAKWSKQAAKHLMFQEIMFYVNGFKNEIEVLDHIQKNNASIHDYWKTILRLVKGSTFYTIRLYAMEPMYHYCSIDSPKFEFDIFTKRALRYAKTSYSNEIVAFRNLTDIMDAYRKDLCIPPDIWDNASKVYDEKIDKFRVVGAFYAKLAKQLKVASVNLTTLSIAAFEQMDNARIRYEDAVCQRDFAEGFSATPGTLLENDKEEEDGEE